MELQTTSQSREEMFNEFDLWITPTLVEIKDTDKYRDELANTQFLLELIGLETNNFAKLEDLNAQAIVDAVLDVSNGKPEAERASIIDNTASLLFLVTGKSDNNAKCQFPLFLRDVSHWEQLPYMRGSKLARKAIPRVLKSTQLSSLVAKLQPEQDIQKQFFTEYVKFILDAPEYIRSLWSIGNSYYRMKQLGLQEDFLMPLVIFKVRGSVSASGGHEPEDLLRKIMMSWGLVAGIDFNTNDVIVGRDTSERKTKTRAFDFVLPYNVEEWPNHIYVQCQFYAGDSGSVSHKNVDQTRSSRNFTKTIVEPEPIFLEYLDGAGYYSSLNGDLRSILSMPDTHGFFQVRTAPLKLRRAFQEIGYLIPLEIVHALALHAFDFAAARTHLQAAGYSDDEITRAIKHSEKYNFLQKTDGKLSVKMELLKTAERYFLLDIIFNNAEPLDDTQPQRGFILVPGLKGINGVKLSSITDAIAEVGGMFAKDFQQSANLLTTLEELAKEGWIIQT